MVLWRFTFPSGLSGLANQQFDHIFFVRKQLGLYSQDSPGGDALTPREEARKIRVKEVAQQGFMYVAFFYVTYTPAFIIRLLEGLGMVLH